MFPRIRAIEKGNALIIYFNRPEVLNAIDLETRKEILSILKNYEAVSNIKCVIFTGEGRAFSSGSDLNFLLSLSNDDAEHYVEFLHEFLHYIENYPKLTIAAINGITIGGGLELVLVVDLAIANEKAKFGLTETNLGLIPGGGGTQRLTRLIGVKRSKQMIYFGEIIDVEDAAKLGIINKVVPSEKLLDEALGICEKMNNRSYEALLSAKKAINSAIMTSLEDGLKIEKELYKKLLLKEETKKRIKEFLERNK